MYSLKDRVKYVTDKRILSNGWRVSEPYRESKQADYVKQMTTELLAIPRQKIAPTTEQSASTQALLEAQKFRPEWRDKEYWDRALPTDWKAVPEAKSNDESVGMRSFTPTEFVLAQSARDAPKNSIGQSESSSVDSEKREKGIEAFTYSEPAKLTPEQIKKLTKLTEIVSTPLEPEEPKEEGFLSRMQLKLQSWWFR